MLHKYEVRLCLGAATQPSQVEDIAGRVTRLQCSVRGPPIQDMPAKERVSRSERACSESEAAARPDHTYHVGSFPLRQVPSCKSDVTLLLGLPSSVLLLTQQRQPW